MDVDPKGGGLFPGLTESKDSWSFSTKFSGGRIPRAGLLMNVLYKKAGGQTVTWRL